MSFKNTGIMFALRVIEKRLKVGGWPDDCPAWLRGVLDNTLYELSNSYFEVEQLLNAFIQCDDYLQLKVLLQNSPWFVDTYGAIDE